jgi:ABC-type polysaccharide/polyol phosphate transport system ATPase subunit
MPEPSIHFENVWKKFHRGEHHDTLRDVLRSFGRRAVARDRTTNKPDEFWALQDMSFEVKPGETLGIIGGNGAGKSTALKLLTRILRPNRGAIRVNGRIGALIEVSAGFHGDLTGRENIYLQGTLMGMRKSTIEAKFDEIVEFSGISEFLDTPVKRYSSGMNARLGFSIAVHLDPDVLIVDEVLAVGDFRFQQRAYARLQDLAQSGRPVVIVSHQLERIAQLCSKAVLLVAGRVHTAGTASECITAYLEHAASLAHQKAASNYDAPVTFRAPRLTPTTPVPVGGEFSFCVKIERDGEIKPTTTIGIRVRSLADKQIVFGTSIARQQVALPSTTTFSLHASMLAHLVPGPYVVEAYAYDSERAAELCKSGPAYLRVIGDEKRVMGLAHLGGELMVTTDESRLTAGAKG